MLGGLKNLLSGARGSELIQVDRDYNNVNASVGGRPLGAGVSAQFFPYGGTYKFHVAFSIYARTGAGTLLQLRANSARPILAVNRLTGATRTLIAAATTIATWVRPGGGAIVVGDVGEAISGNYVLNKDEFLAVDNAAGGIQRMFDWGTDAGTANGFLTAVTAVRQ